MGVPTDGGRSQAYQALHDSEELHRATLGSISDAVFLTDDRGVFTYVCPNVDVIFGYVPDEVHAMGLIDRLLGERLFQPEALAIHGELRNLERVVTTKNGDRRALLVHVKKVAIRRGTVLYTCRDVTEYRQAEEALRDARRELAHASRLALAGELLGSIAHEIKQPLGAMLANAGAGLRLTSTTGESADVAHALKDIHADAQRAIAIIERLQLLMRKKTPEVRPLDMNDIVRETMRIVESEAQRRQVALEMNLEPTLPAVAADRVSVQQVVLNLALNAMDAMDGTEAARRRLVVATRGTAAGVEVAVRDAGTGIGAEVLPKLFDPFFTTKPAGLGLGLSIARSIVEAHAGTIRAEDLASGGAMFRFHLPAAAGRGQTPVGLPTGV